MPGSSEMSVSVRFPVPSYQPDTAYSTPSLLAPNSITLPSADADTAAGPVPRNSAASAAATLGVLVVAIVYVIVSPSTTSSITSPTTAVFTVREYTRFVTLFRIPTLIVSTLGDCEEIACASKYVEPVGEKPAVIRSEASSNERTRSAPHPDGFSCDMISGIPNDFRVGVRVDAVIWTETRSSMNAMRKG